MVFLVISDNKCGEQVPLQLGTLVTDHLVMTMTSEERQQAGETLKQVHISTVLSKRNTVESPCMPKYDLLGMKGKNWMMQKVMILPLATIMWKGATKLTTHSKYMTVIVEPVVGYSDHVATARFYGVLRPWVSKVEVCLWNHCAKQITVPQQITMGEIAAANAILALLVPTPTENDFCRDWGYHKAKANERVKRT